MVVEVPDVRATLHRRNERRARERVVIAGARSEQKVLELQEKMLYAEANLAYHCPTVMGFMPANLSFFLSDQGKSAEAGKMEYEVHTLLKRAGGGAEGEGRGAGGGCKLSRELLKAADMLLARVI